MAVGHRGHRAESAGSSGALSSRTMMVTITAKTASENAVSRSAVVFSSRIARWPFDRLRQIPKTVSVIASTQGPRQSPAGVRALLDGDCFATLAMTTTGGYRVTCADTASHLPPRRAHTSV